MRNANNSVETINAAATAIVSAEARTQPSSVPKSRWGSCWSLYWCFGYHKSNKRIGHAVLVPEPTVSESITVPSAENQTRSTTMVLPFIAPPSSPASFLQSDPPSSTQSPGGLMSLTSLSVNAYSPGGPASIFAIGPYAYETQLVSPPVFSTYTTEPSTAPFTPPPESVQQTTPSSPEVPYARLLTSSLYKTRGYSGTNPKFVLSHGEFQPYQQYPGSSSGYLISPGSAVSNSGTSSPFLNKQAILELRKGEAPKLLGFEHFITRKWGSRLSSGSLTPEGVGQGSRLGSGSLTPDGYGLGSGVGSGSLTPTGVGLGSRLGSGSLTPTGAGLGSRLGSGSLTPVGLGPVSRDHILLENKISDIASVTNFRGGCQTDESLIDHRVSFELTGEGVARCLANKSAASIRSISSLNDITTESSIDEEEISKDGDNFDGLSICKTSSGMQENENGGGDHCYQKHRSVTLGSAKEFNFDSTKAEFSEKPRLNSEWWANEKVDGKNLKTGNSWSFFPMLQPEVS